METINVATPIIDATPTSCHKKYVTIIVSKGPMNTKPMYTTVKSNRITSFDIRFTIRPVVVSRELVFSRNAYKNKIII